MKRKNTWNEGARLLGELRRDGETVEGFGARVLGRERTISGRILSGERPPGAHLRHRLEAEFGIPWEAWAKKIPHPDKPSKSAAA